MLMNHSGRYELVRSSACKSVHQATSVGRVIVVLFLSIAASWLIAWTLVLAFSGHGPFSHQSVDADSAEAIWSTYGRSEWKDERAEAGSAMRNQSWSTNAYTVAGPFETRTYIIVHDHPTAPPIREQVIERFEQGWPFRCLTATLAHDNKVLLKDGITGGVLLDAGSLMSPMDRVPHNRVLVAYYPILSGALACVALYFTVITAVCIAGQVGQVAWRIMRNRCPMCGQNLGPDGDLSLGCPECGWNRQEAEKTGGRSA
jgi:hypothetical protein